MAEDNHAGSLMQTLFGPGPAIWLTDSKPIVVGMGWLSHMLSM